MCIVSIFTPMSRGKYIFTEKNRGSGGNPDTKARELYPGEERIEVYQKMRGKKLVAQACSQPGLASGRNDFLFELQKNVSGGPVNQR